MYMFEAYLLDRGTVRAMESGFSISSKSGSGSRVLMTKKMKKKYTAEHFLFLFDQKFQFTYVQATGEPSALKRKHPTLHK
jgi:hypothetical protein